MCMIMTNMRFIASILLNVSEFRMALVIIYAVLSHFDFVAKFTVNNRNKDFTNTGRGGRGHHFMKVFHKTEVFFKGWLPLFSSFGQRNEDPTL